MLMVSVYHGEEGNMVLKWVHRVEAPHLDESGSSGLNPEPDVDHLPNPVPDNHFYKLSLMSERFHGFRKYCDQLGTKCPNILAFVDNVHLSQN